MSDHYSSIVDFVQNTFGTKEFIPLHEPRFVGKEKEYLMDCVDSTFVSSVGEYVDRFEAYLAELTGAKYAVAVVNGTAALQVGLRICGVEQNDEVITQPLTFIATCNAIAYLGAKPVFVDVDKTTMGLGYDQLKLFLEEHTEQRGEDTYNTSTGRRIKACVPMHSFGFPCEIDKIVELCDQYNIEVVEDAAESLGSYYNGKHTGLFGTVGTVSFNGNKIVTCGGGGAIITDNEELAKLAKHLTTTAKIPHKWEYRHDHMGYNYRMPNLNAALACAQLEQLKPFTEKKRTLAKQYEAFFADLPVEFKVEQEGTRANYWLNTVLLKDLEERNAFLTYTNEHGVMTRPAWTMMNRLEMYKDCFAGNLDNAQWLEDRIVNIPSSVIL